jgi:pilus assembly protein CpaC
MALLRDKLREQTELQNEIAKLRAETRTQQQYVVHVELLEFSLTNMRKMGFDIPGISAGRLSETDLAGMMRTAKPKAGVPSTPGEVNNGSNDASSIISCLKSNNICKVLAEPNIVVVDGRPAQFCVGGEIPMPAKDSTKAVEYQPFGTQVDFVATSIGQDRVRLDIRARVSEVDEGKSVEIEGSKVPAIVIRQQCDTAVIAKLGQPTALSGQVRKSTEAQKTETGTQYVSYDLSTMFVVTVEPFEEPKTAQRASGP